MGKIGKDKNGKKDENMTSAIAKKQLDIKAKLEIISRKAKLLTGEDRMIELDPKNPLHREWFEVDKYKGE
ncbi:MAG: hypothetical protein PHS52_03515 [Desulfotomaculaceae bacterium]|nr:hypothetical protein [Desulfotomaculaceae bacterium]